jgi:hypothetical protein
MIHLPEFDQFTAKFAQCAVEPLRVTFNLRPNSQIVNYDPIHFDGLLARAVVELATAGRLLADSEEGYWIPLPLKMLWQDEGGFPLWAASVLYPVGPNVGDVYVRHKRNSEGWLHNKPKMQTRSGPWMERRLPTPTLVCSVFEARCIGNLEWVQKLCDYFTHIGKLRLGRVFSVLVEPADYTEQNVITDEGVLIKPVPVLSGLVPWLQKPSLVGWTPPFWKPSLFADGWHAGTRIEPLLEEIDFYESAPS